MSHVLIRSPKFVVGEIIWGLTDGHERTPAGVNCRPAGQGGRSLI